MTQSCGPAAKNLQTGSVESDDAGVEAESLRSMSTGVESRGTAADTAAAAADDDDDDKEVAAAASS